MFWKSFYADDIQPEIQVAPPGGVTRLAPALPLYPN